MFQISSHPLVTKLGEFFEPSYGNVVYLFLTSTGEIRGVRNPGSSEFHYLSPSKVREFGLEKWAYPNATLEDALIYPAITSARQTNFFTFDEKDWEEMRKSDDKCYMFVCHKPREKLSKEVADYIGSPSSVITYPSTLRCLSTRELRCSIIHATIARAIIRPTSLTSFFLAITSPRRCRSKY
jgi:hypothetical protein